MDWFVVILLAGLGLALIFIERRSRRLTIADVSPGSPLGSEIRTWKWKVAIYEKGLQSLAANPFLSPETNADFAGKLLAVGKKRDGGKTK